MARKETAAGASSPKAAAKPAASRRTARKGGGQAAPDLNPNDSLAYIVREVHRAWMRSLEARISKYGITSGMWWFLRLLWIEDGISQAELSDRLKVMGPTTVRAMDRLEKFGLIRREPSVEDKRKVLIYLTPAGRGLKADLMPVAIEVVNLGTKSLSPAESALARELLRRVLADLNADPQSSRRGAIEAV